MRRRSAGAVVAVAAAYVSFLLHAQFALLALMSRAGEGAAEVRLAMAAMGVAGIGASLLTGALLRRASGRLLARVGFLGCAVAALASLIARAPLEFVVVAAIVGTFTGMVTVAVAARLAAWVPREHLGLHAGLGTGTAYFLANVPAIFHGGPVVQSLVAAGACVLGAWACPAGEESGAESREAAIPWSFLTLVAGFLALVWLDSAAFRIVQDDAALRGGTWGEGGRTLVQGGVHLVAAVVAGVLLDRGRLRSLLVATSALFALAFPLLASEGRLSGALYATGISLYSTALVVAPSLGPAASRARRAAILYAVAGWVGSALGVGMAQDLHRIPQAFTLGAGAIVVAGALLDRPGLLRAVAPTAGAALALGAVGLAASPRHARTPERDAIALGRATYVSEGCIQCHSQFVRPGADESAWGPRRLDQLEEHPPLLGTRRLGPDLLNVGARRDAAWQRLHLIDPRSLSPGSRMPSYARLFAPGDPRGPALVAYLGSLGASTLAERVALNDAEREPRGEPDAALGAATFARSCAPCHGARGRGDGPLAAQVGSPFLDLAMAGLPRMPRIDPGGDERLDLERLIRRGSPGTAMAGHELFDDRTLVSVAAHVQSLRAEAQR